MSKKKLTQVRLKELLHYDPETGIFIWRKFIQHMKKDRTAGSLRPDGYIQIQIDGKFYRAHRIAWFYVHGYFPENEIDHRDRIRHHNWIKNLREASRSCNAINSNVRKDNSSGINGVSFNKLKNSWHANIGHKGKLAFLGYYKSFDDAVCARLAGEQCLGWSGCNSSSASYKYIKKMIRSI